MFSIIISVVLCVVGSHDSTIDCVHINGFLCSVLLLHMQLQYLVERRSKINGFVQCLISFALFTEKGVAGM